MAASAMDVMEIHFVDNPALKGREDRYEVVKVETRTVINSWRESLFSFEWLTQNGTLRSLDDLPLHERDKRLRVEKTLREGGVMERPVLGIGLLDNIEIGAGRDVFLTLAAKGKTHIEVHIPRSSREDFKPYIQT